MPVRAKPDSRPRLEGVRYINTRQAAHSYSIPPSPYTSLTHTAHTYQFPSSPWASALNRYMVSALESRVGWTPARKEQTNKQLTNHHTQTYRQQPNNTDTQTHRQQPTNLDTETQTTAEWHTNNSWTTQTHRQQPTNTDTDTPTTAGQHRHTDNSQPTLTTLVSASAFRQPSTTCSTSLPAQHLWLSGLLSRRPHSLELSPGFYPGPHHQCRLFQTFAKDVFVCSILVHSARLRFSTITALYKSTYLLTTQTQRQQLTNLFSANFGTHMHAHAWYMVPKLPYNNSYKKDFDKTLLHCASLQRLRPTQIRSKITSLWQVGVRYN